MTASAPVAPGGWPHPLHEFETGYDPTYGTGTATYSPGRNHRYQLTRRFSRGALRVNQEATLVVLGLHPDPKGSAATLDEWLMPYAYAAEATRFEQLIAVNLYAAPVEALDTLGHWAHGPLNGYFADPEYLARLASTIAVALPPEFTFCKACQEQTQFNARGDERNDRHFASRAKGKRGLLADLACMPEVDLVRLLPPGDPEVWAPYEVDVLADGPA